MKDGLVFSSQELADREREQRARLHAGVHVRHRHRALPAVSQAAAVRRLQGRRASAVAVLHTHAGSFLRLLDALRSSVIFQSTFPLSYAYALSTGENPHGDFGTMSLLRRVPEAGPGRADRPGVLHSAREFWSGEELFSKHSRSPWSPTRGASGST